MNQSRHIADSIGITSLFIIANPIAYNAQIKLLVLHGTALMILISLNFLKQNA